VFPILIFHDFLVLPGEMNDTCE